MGIPKYLEEKIKSIVHCCTAAIQAAITPNSSTFLLRRPNDETFVLGGPNGDQATVGMADYANVGTLVATGKQYSTVDVYEGRYEVSLDTTGGTITLETGVDRIFEVDIIFLEGSTGIQYYVNGTINTLCDAGISVNSNELIIQWSTAHTIDTVYVIARFTLA